MPFQWLDAKLDHRSINPLKASSKAPKLSYKAEALAQTMNCTV